MSPDTLGPYQLGEPLGKGGMGTVYRGVHEESGEAVAVKVLNPRLAVAEGFRERFESEIESLKALRHAGIVRLLGYGEQDGTLFYAMELVEGSSLEEELRNGRRFAWREVTQIGIQVCRALKHAHDHGVIHRDLKPANILLAPDGRPKLADFGIARVFGSTGVTIAGGVLGTADYMSPEQAAGKPVNARCDQYSLGGVLYALLAGRPPFRAGDLASMLQLQRFAIPEPVRRFAPETPQELERILAKMLEKDPADRFPNTQVVARRLEAMSQALSRVAPDDFEVLPTGATPADSEAVSSESVERVAMAVTLDAEDETAAFAAPANPPPAAAPPLTGVASYTPVESYDDADDGGSAWLAIGGQTAVLVLALATLAAVAWWLGKPPTADQLHQRVSRAAEETDASSAALDAVREFQRRFPDDPRTDQVVAWGRTLRLEQLRRKLQLARLGGQRDESMSPEEALLRRAAALAAADPLAGAAAFDGLAALIAAGEASSRNAALADLARNEAERLREAARERRAELAAYCLERIEAARDLVDNEPATARAIASAVRDLLPESEETRAALDAADTLSRAAGPPAVAADR